MIEALEQHLDYLKRLPVDIRAEVVLADLIEYGLNPDDLVMYSMGLSKRTFHRDIESVELLKAIGDRSTKLNVELNREGIYDALPEGLFHQPTNRKPNKSKEETLTEIRIQKGKEKAARKFFLPLEQEFFRQRILLETEERALLSNDENTAQDELFIDFWQIPAIFDERQIVNLSYLLPIAHKIAGNEDLTALCMSCILGNEISLNEAEPFTFSGKEIPESRLNQISLGADFVIGDTYQEMIPATEIAIGPLTKTQLLDYLPNGKKTQMLAFLQNYFIPFEADTLTSLQVQEIEKDFLLNDSPADARLGYSCFL